MGFIGINDQNKQRINISPYAAGIIEHDVRDFNLKNRDTLINTILRHAEMHSISSASHLAKYSENLFTELSEIDVKCPVKIIVEKLTQKEKQRLIDEHSRYSTHKRNQIGFYIRISNDVRKWLEGDLNTEDKYYSSLEQYINVAVESYAQKNDYQRELVIFDSLIGQLNRCIKDEIWLDMYSVNSTNRVFPVKVDSDKSQMHAYLVGYRLDKASTCKPVTYRISSLPADIRSIENVDKAITNDDIQKLYELISERGIQFLSEPAVDIEVALTYSGIRTYERTRHLRPEHIKISSYRDTSINHRFEAVYTFHCTERQAEYYFLRFGSDALILSPKRLKDRFREKHDETTKLYHS